MKLKFTIDIDADRDAVWAALDNTENFGRWQQNFSAYRHCSGTPGHPGAVAELVFDEGGRQVVLTETITERRQPDFFAATYEADHGTTLIVNHFDAIDDHHTRWTSWCSFSFRGWMKWLALFMVGKIRKRTEGDLQRFKLMVESDLAAGGDS